MEELDRDFGRKHRKRLQMKTKTCPPGSGCGRTLPATLDYFYRDCTRVDGLSNYCRECMKRKGRENHAKHIKETVTTSTHFRCEAMQSTLSVLVCLKRQKDKGFRPITRGIPGRNTWIEYWTCIGDCKQGKEVKERIRRLL